MQLFPLGGKVVDEPEMLRPKTCEDDWQSELMEKTSKDIQNQSSSHFFEKSDPLFFKQCMFCFVFALLLCVHSMSSPLLRQNKHPSKPASPFGPALGQPPPLFSPRLASVEVCSQCLLPRKLHSMRRISLRRGRGTGAARHGALWRARRRRRCTVRHGAATPRCLGVWRMEVHLDDT